MFLLPTVDYCEEDNMTVYRRVKNGPYYMNFAINGIRVFRSTGKHTKREAKQVEAEESQRLLKESSMSPGDKSQKMLLGDAIEDVYRVKWQHGKDGMRSYRRACNLMDLIGNLALGMITEQVVNVLIGKLHTQGAAPATVNRYLTSLKTILRHYKQDASFIKLRKEPKGRIRTLSREEEAEVVSLLTLNQSGRRTYYPEVGEMVMVLVDTGMRLSEALNLTYEDIDFQTGLLSIWINKSDRPRSLPMTSRVRRILESRRETNPVKPFSVKAHQAETAWRWTRKKMGLERDSQFVIHALRHTCASRLIAGGVDLYVVKEWLGHSSIQVTERYAHLSPSKLAQAALALE